MNEMEFKVNTPQLLKEITTNPLGAVMRIPLNIFQNLLGRVAVRASQLNDPELDKLMIQLALYAVGDPYDTEYDPKVVSKYMKMKFNQKTPLNQNQ